MKRYLIVYSIGKDRNVMGHDCCDTAAEVAETLVERGLDPFDENDKTYRLFDLKLKGTSSTHLKFKTKMEEVKEWSI